MQSPTAVRLWMDLKEKHAGQFKASHITLIAAPGETVLLEAAYPGLYNYCGVKLGLCQAYDSMNEFLAHFPIKELSDLDSLTPELLLPRYEQTGICVSAWVEGGYGLRLLLFRMHDAVTYMTDVEADQVFITDLPLTSPEQFVEYAMAYNEEFHGQFPASPQ